jgi:hypothetical protein
MKVRQIQLNKKFCNFISEPDRQRQVVSEEKQKKRNLFILESESMTNDVKNWWKSTINDIDL